MVDICEIFSEVDMVVFSTSKLNKNSASPPLPGSDEIEISNAGWTWTESDARVDLNPPSSFVWEPDQNFVIRARRIERTRR